MIHAKIASLDQRDNRAAARRLVNFGARMGRGAAADSHNVVVVDLSAEGCRLLLCGARIAEGSVLWIKLPDQEARRIHVVWTRDGEAGCEFSQPLTEDELGSARPRHPLTGIRRSRFGLRAGT